jgi:hypothetical protein
MCFRILHSVQGCISWGMRKLVVAQTLPPRITAQRDTVTRFFASGFFHESVSPQPQSIPLGPFQIFSKFAEIFASQGATLVSTTPAANFATSSASIVDSSGKFATGVINTGGK